MPEHKLGNAFGDPVGVVMADDLIPDIQHMTIILGPLLPAQVFHGRAPESLLRSLGLIRLPARQMQIKPRQHSGQIFLLRPRNAPVFQRRGRRPRRRDQGHGPRAGRLGVIRFHRF